MSDADRPATQRGDKLQSTSAAPSTDNPLGGDNPHGSNTDAVAGRWWAWAMAGVVSVLAGLGAAELTAALLAPASSPLLVVGSLVIDSVPGWVKDVTVSLFGTADKVVLLIILGVLVALLAAVAGIVERRRPPFGRVIVALVGLVAVVAAVTRAHSGPLDSAASLVAIVVAVLVLAGLAKALRRARGSTSPASADRRRFLAVAGVTAGLGALAVIGGRALAVSRQVTEVVRAAIRLPKPVVAAPALAPGTALQVTGLTPLVTPNADFYRIDTALQVPNIDPKDWSLKITGMVDDEVELTFAELMALPLEESYTTLTCVSNYVGGDLIGNAKWLGYPIRELLTRAGPQPGADMVLSRSIDGFTASSPLSALTDGRNAILAVGMNDEPLPLEHGFPVRMVVPGLYGYVSATKWVVSMEVTTFAKQTAYWTDRGWSERGPVKLSSRIDVPSDGAAGVKAGTVAVAGVAWEQHVGISGVQVRVDGGQWNDAELADAISADTWRQWVWRWPATTGSHQLTVRAIDANGVVQTSRIADVVPDGATGLHSIDVQVS
jgi:DMSO/TMAO reductase YedYZ molybdopterin-dependent catalytic subunit